MTRYLPIRKEEFDLRSHVESSGHSVDTCRQVVLAEKACRGYLVKMGGKIKSWKKRWFVFDRLKRTFSYYVGKTVVSGRRRRRNPIGCGRGGHAPSTGVGVRLKRGAFEPISCWGAAPTCQAERRAGDGGGVRNGASNFDGSSGSL